MDLDQHRDRRAAAQWLRIDICVTADRRFAQLDVAGELDDCTTTELWNAVHLVLAAPAPERVQLRAAGLTFVDTAGIRCLLNCRTAAQNAGSRLTLVDPGPQLVQVLDITGLLPVFGLAGHAGSDTPRQIEPWTDTGRGPHRGQPLPELFEQSAALRETARQTCARARAARRVRLVGVRSPDTVAD